VEDSTYRSQGQAIVELTIASALLFCVVCASLSITAALKKTMKHDFMPADLRQRDGTEGLEKFGKVFISKDKTDDILERLQNEGWSEDRRLKIPEGLIMMFSNGARHLDLIKNHSQILGVYH